MKRRNLFLSLISSVLVAVAIVTVTIVSVVKPSKKNNNDNVPGASNIAIDSGIDYSEYELENQSRDGSKELPYLIYSAESYNDMLTNHGADNCYFEIAEDIDFTGVDYKTLFNKADALNATIYGKLHSLSNITIHVTEENVADFSLYNSASVAMFGNVDGASINNLVINNLKVIVDSAVYTYVTNWGYKQFITSSFAGSVKNSTFDNVTVNANVTGFSNYFTGSGNLLANTMGGFAGKIENVTITNSNVNSELNVIEGSEFNIGGVAGYGIDSTLTDTNVNVKLVLSHENRVSVGGLFAQVRTMAVKNTNVQVDIQSNDSEEKRTAFVESLGKNPSNTQMSHAAGIVAYIRANDDTQKSTFDNIKVTSNVNADLVYAGAFIETMTNMKTADFSKHLDIITVNDVIVDTNANVLALHGFARELGLATVTYSDEAQAQEGYFNIRIRGSVKLDSYGSEIGTENEVIYPAVSIYTAVDNYGKCNMDICDLYVEVSSSIYTAIVSQTAKRIDFHAINRYYGNIDPTFASFKRDI